jgi:DNA-binding transcriptional MerR regulator
MEKHKTYSIGTVARKVGVPKYKLRHWCDRYLPEIQKIDIADMQHRRFTDRDIELIKSIKAYRDRGFTLEAAIENARNNSTAEGQKPNLATIDSTQDQKEV